MKTDRNTRPVSGHHRITSALKRHSHWILYISVLYFSEFSSDCISQSNPISILSVNNGLLSGVVECGLSDSRGFVWLGTREGLHRFDGKNVFRYLPDKTDPGAISSLHITSLAEDPHGQIWITGNSGVEVFLPEENCFELLKSYPYALPTINPLIWMIDSLDIGILHSHIDHNHSMVVSLSERRFVPALTDLSQSAQRMVKEFWMDKRNVIKYFTEQDKLSYDYLNFFHDRNDDLVRSARDETGIWFYTFKKGGFTKLTHGQTAAEWKPVYHAWPEIEKDGAMTMIDYNDTLGLAGLMGYGIFLFHKITGEVLREWDFRQDASLSRTTNINFLFNDPAGRVWFSLLPYGVFVFDPLSPRFQLLKNGMEKSILHQGLMRSLTCDSLGRLWIGYHDGQVQVLDPEAHKELLSFNLGVDRNKVMIQAASIDKFPDGSIWIQNNLFVDMKGDQISLRQNLEQDSVASYGFNHPFAIPEKVIQMYGLGPKWLYIFDVTSKTIRPFPKGMPPLHMEYIGNDRFFYAGDLHSFGVMSVEEPDTCIIIDKKWCGFSVQGVYRNPKSDSIWMATDKGLTIYNTKTFAVEEIKTQDWPSRYLYSILPDQNGNFWISSNGGLIRYHPKTKKTRFIGVPEGMQSNEFNTNCYAVLKDGSFAFGGPEGLNVFHPSYFEDRDEPFYVYASSASIGDKPVSDFNSFHSTFSLKLHPHEKSLEVSYGATKYLERTGLQYFVRLEGADADWVNRGDLETVRYINLKPDTYHLQIKARDGSGNWSRNEITGTIIVRPTFFQTTWFLILCVLVVAGILYALYRYRIRQLKNIMAIRNRISRDLHDDIGSTLGSISIYSEVAKTTSGENRTDVLDKIGEASREMLEKLNDIVWSINPDNDSLERMEKRMRSYAAMMLNPLGVSFELTLKTDQQFTRLDMDHRRNIFLIFKEALHNAAKYSGCRHIHILLEEQHGMIRMEITDDGKGFTPGHINGFNGNGIDSMRERAKVIGAQFFIDSQPGKGTRIRIQQK